MVYFETITGRRTRRARATKRVRTTQGVPEKLSCYYQDTQHLHAVVADVCYDLLGDCGRSNLVTCADCTEIVACARHHRAKTNLRSLHSQASTSRLPPMISETRRDTGLQSMVSQNLVCPCTWNTLSVARADGVLDAKLTWCDHCGWCTHQFGACCCLTVPCVPRRTSTHHQTLHTAYIVVVMGSKDVTSHRKAVDVIARTYMFGQDVDPVN
jgi:hypothetical protein